MMRRTSLAMSYHFTKLLAENQPIPNLYNEKIYNDTYFKNWLKIGIDNVFPDESVQANFIEINGYLDKVLDSNSIDENVFVKQYPKYFDQVINHAGRLLRTVVHNNAYVPLFPRLARLTKYKLEIMGEKGVNVYTVMKQIRSSNPDYQDFSSQVQDYVELVRMNLCIKDGQDVYDEYGKEKIDFPTIIKFNYWMQNEFTLLGERRLKLMPIFGVGRIHVRLDEKTLFFFAKSFRRVSVIGFFTLSKIL
jgi:hypothetical protein